MEETDITFEEPLYTVTRVGNKIIFLLATALVLACVAAGISGYADSRHTLGLIGNRNFDLLTQSVAYSFGIIAVTTLSLVLIEIAFRKRIYYVQYGLISCALCLFYLLLLAVAELTPFAVAYAIVTAMTIGLIAVFVKGITRNVRAVVLITAILAVEYAMLLVLVYIGTLALLIGSLSIFALLALAMYFTLKLKIVNNELTLK